MKNLENKKILLIVVVAILLVIFVAVVSGSSNIYKTQQINPPQQTSKNNNINTTSTGTTTIYHGDTYAFSYPNGWNRNQRQLDNNAGILFHIKPSTQNSGDFTDISIEIFNAQVTPITNVTNVFKLANYTQTTSQVAGVTAQKYAGVIQAPTGNLHTIAYVFEKDNKIYFLKLEYTRPSIDESLEDQFAQIVSSFSLK